MWLHSEKDKEQMIRAFDAELAEAIPSLGSVRRLTGKRFYEIALGYNGGKPFLANVKDEPRLRLAPKAASQPT